jgi:uncharacterized protein (TIGR00730 family)
MGVLAGAMLAEDGEVIGVIPKGLASREFAHTGLTDLRLVDTMHERKAAMASLADGFIALPGGLGTMEETFEVLTWAQLGIHRKPVGVLNVSGYFDALLRFLAHGVREGFILRQYFELLLFSDSPDDLLDQFAKWTPPVFPRIWLDATQT